MQLEASLVCVRALLTSGHDADAVGFAKQVLTGCCSAECLSLQCVYGQVVTFSSEGIQLHSVLQYCDDIPSLACPPRHTSSVTLYINRMTAELLPHLQAAKQVETWFPDDAQSQARQQAQLEANTSLLAALHATGDLKAAASIAEGVTESASRLARKTANKIPDACVTAAHAQAIAIRLATAAQVSPLLAWHRGTPKGVFH